MQVKDLQWKRALRTALLVLLMSAAGMGKMYADFYNVPIGDLRYDLNDNTMTATVRGHVNGAAATGTLTIPESVPYNGLDYSVTVIWESAFQNCSGFTGSLTIPNSVITIDNWAFMGCTGLTGSLNIGNSVTEIGTRAFYNCRNIISLTIGNSVRGIADEAFYNCKELSSVTWPNSNSLTYIGSWAFGHDSKLYSISIPNSVTFIYGSAFNYTGWYNNQPGGVLYLSDWCLGYKDNEPTGELEILPGTKGLADGIFGYCSELTSLNLPSSLLYINGVGSYCGITSVTIPGSVISIGTFAFSGCPNFTSVYYTGNIAQWCAISFGDDTSVYGTYVFRSGYNLFVGNVLVTQIPEIVTSIGQLAFANCGSLTGNLIIPNTVTTIGEGAFYGCNGISSVTIPSSVNMIGYGAFDCGTVYYTGDIAQWCNISFEGTTFPEGYDLYIGNDLVTQLVIPETVTSIGQFAFGFCGSLTSVTIPSSVIAIGGGAFYDYQAIDVWYTGDIAQWCGISFGVWPFPEGYNLYMGNDLVTQLVIPETVTSIGQYAFCGCGNVLGDLLIPNSVTSIGEHAFYGCSGFAGSLTLGNSVTTIGHYAFYGCSGFTGSLTIPNSVTTIDAYAFYNCTGFTGSLTLGNSVTTIGGCAFEGCSGFVGNLTIGNSVTYIDYYAFSGCSGFTSMNVLPETPPAISLDSPFYPFPKSIPVYVPCGSMEAYQSATYWNWFTNIQENCSQSQTVTLSAGWNWFSPNVEITLEDLQNALMDAAPNANITIKSNTQNIAYNPGTNQWRGTLDSLDVSQMYMIQVGADCQITLTGTSINPNACPITIHNGNNWIAFPLSESMSISDAFSGFATNGDIIKSRTTTARYNNGNWRGGLDSLEPGQGYIYKSNVTETRTFTFPTSAK